MSRSVAAVGTGRTPVAVAKYAAAAIIPAAVGVWLWFAANPQTGKSVALILFALALWTTEIIPRTLAALIVLILEPLLHLLPVNDFMQPFGSPILWMFVATFIIGAAFQHSGVSDALAATVLRHSRSGPRLALNLVVLYAAAAVAIPNSLARVAVLLPVMEAIDRSGRFPNARRFLYLSLAFSSTVVGTLAMTSSNSSIYAAGLLAPLLHHSLSYWQWLGAFGPPDVLLLLVIHVILYLKYPFQVAAAGAGPQPARQRWTRRQAKLGLLALLTFVGWSLSRQIGLSVAYITFAAAIVMVLPRIGVISWAEGFRAIDWSTTLFFGATLTIPEVLQVSHVTPAIVHEAIALTGTGTVQLVLAVALATFVLRMALFNAVTLTATELPLIVEVARHAQSSLVLLSVLTIAIASLGLVLPVQSPGSLRVYALDRYSLRDYMTTGLLVSVMALALLTVTALTYWGRVLT